MRKAFCLFVFLTLALCRQQGLQAQDRISPKRPITLPGFDSDASPEQEAVQSLIQKGASEDRMGDYNSAVRSFQDALKKLRSVPEMKGDEDSLLVRLGRAYIGARRLDDAVGTFALLLGPRMEECRLGVAAVEYCGDAQYYIGFVYMQKGNFEGAVPFLTKSMGSYARAASGSEFAEYQMIKLKQQAETEAMLAAALLRTGSKARSIDALNHAISQLSTVEANADIQDSIRVSARRSLQDARKALEAARKN
jgi:tetratricopeptide (TPR) repeat protein